MTRRLMVMAAGTGGHIMPGLAVAEEMRGRGWIVTWLGTTTGMENRLVPARGITLDTIGFGGLRGKGLWYAMTGGVRMLNAMRQSLSILRARKPDAVLGMGGYVTVPGGLMASVANVPLIIHNADAAMLLSNRILAPVADRMSFGFASSAAKKYGKRAEVTGNPVRADIARLPAPDQRFTNRSGPLRLLVVGGSLGARPLNRTVPSAIARMAVEKRPIVVHQTGANELDSVRNDYAANGGDAQRVECVAFIDDMASRYAEADIVLCRAGAITVAELAAAGVPSILVPLMLSTTSHQRDNAMHMAEGNAAIHLPQAEMTPDSLAQRLSGLERGQLLAMASSARALGRPDATRRVADVCERIARRANGATAAPAPAANESKAP